MALARPNSRPMEHNNQDLDFTTPLDFTDMDLRELFPDLEHDNYSSSRNNMEPIPESNGQDFSFNDPILFPEDSDGIDWGMQMAELDTGLNIADPLDPQSQDWFPELPSPGTSSASNSLTPLESDLSTPVALFEHQLWMPDWNLLEETSTEPGPIPMVPFSAMDVELDISQHWPTASPPETTQPVPIPQVQRPRAAPRSSHTCSRCGQTCTSTKDLRRHEKSVHLQQRTEKCPYADCAYHEKGFARKDMLQRHLKRIH